MPTTLATDTELLESLGLRDKSEITGFDSLVNALDARIIRVRGEHPSSAVATPGSPTPAEAKNLRIRAERLGVLLALIELRKEYTGLSGYSRNGVSQTTNDLYMEEMSILRRLGPIRKYRFSTD